jgi:putative transposase
VIQVVCDNAGFHKPEKRKVVKDYVKEWGHCVVLHYLPTYSPDCNPVERVWWRLHEAVTRNHRCRTIDELLDLTFDWFAARTHFRIESTVYGKTP